MAPLFMSPNCFVWTEIETETCSSSLIQSLLFLSVKNPLQNILAFFFAIKYAFAGNHMDHLWNTIVQNMREVGEHDVEEHHSSLGRGGWEIKSTKRKNTKRR